MPDSIEQQVQALQDCSKPRKGSLTMSASWG
jgi:hypothetical protein